MASTKHTLLIGNWKMNPRTLADARKLYTEVRSHLKGKRRAVEVMVAPPTPFLADIGRLSPSGSIGLVAQHMSAEPVGAHTGEVSAPMLKSVGVVGIIIGHSERRAAGMRDTEVAAVLTAALKAQLVPVVCIGERERDAQGDFYDVIESQLRTALQGVSAAAMAKVVLAYEPVWAIGTGQNASPEDVEEMRLFIQKVVSGLYSRKVGEKVSILYGGSVNPKNAADLLTTTAVDGFLVGGASLKSKDFGELIDICDQHDKSTT